MRKAIFVFLVISIFVFSIIPLSFGFSEPMPNKVLLRHFLENQYVPQIGLLRAATRAYPDNVTIYVANDNVLAARALAVLGSPLASKILTVLNNNFSGGFNGKVDILVGKNIPDTFYASYDELVKKVDGYRIVYEKLDHTKPIKDWYDYADLLVYHALDRLLWGSRPEAEKAFLNLTRMWDGYGFRDRAFNGIYAVYKCALFIYLYRALESAGSTIIYEYQDIYEKCLEIIAKAQDPVKGGIHTDYRVVNGRILIQGDMNTETTSIVVLALYSNYPEIIGRKAYSPWNAVSYGYRVAEIVIPYSLGIMMIGSLYVLFRKLM